MANTVELENLAGKVAVVTGATSGIGKEIARGLAERGARVVLAVRDVQKGEAVRSELGKTTGNLDVEVLRLDVSDPASVRAFAAEVTRRHPRLHILVNNAGAWFSDRRESKQGIELTWATNVLGPYLLSALLTDALKAAGLSRIVNVVSGLAANYDPTDLEFRRRGYDGFKVYAQSKQALRMLTWGLAARLDGNGVTVNAVAPGFVRTNFNGNARGFVAGLINTGARLFGRTPAEGADTPVWAASAPELRGVTGKLFDSRKEVDGNFREPGPIAELEQLCARMIDGSTTVPSAGATERSALSEARG